MAGLMSVIYIMKRRAISPLPNPRSRLRQTPRATFRFDIRTAAGAPHVITFTPTTPGAETEAGLRTAAGTLATEIRRQVTASVMNYTNWGRRYALTHVRGIISAINLEGGGNASGNEITELNRLRAEDLIAILENIQESNAEVGFFDIEWQFWITPQSLVRGGSQNISKPKWHTSAAFSQTWKGYSDSEGPISCAAFAIVWSLYSNFDFNIGGDKNKHYNRINPAIKDARKLMQELNWESDVTLASLKDFTVKYPSKKLIVISPFALVPSAVYIGSDFDSTREEKFLKQDTIFLTFCAVQLHYGATRTPNQIIENAHGRTVGKSSGTWSWCHHCDEPYYNLSPTPHTCEDARNFHQRLKSRTCKECNMVVTGRCYNCQGRECKTCASTYENNTFHRCLFMTRKSLNSHFENEDHDIDEEEDEFFKPADNDYRLIIADLESAMYSVDSNRQSIQHFMFTEEGQYDPEGVVAVDEEDFSPLTDIAFYGFQHIEQRANYCYAEDGCDDSVKKMFKGEDCLFDFIEWVTSYNDGKNIVLFHYGSGYDARLIFAAAHKRYKTTVKAPIIRGTKFLELKIGRTIFRDSILHIPGSLHSLGESFKPPGGLLKGHFPVLYNTVENLGKVLDKPPPLEYFAIPKNKAAYLELVNWHKNFEGPWDFNKEIEKYVIADVKVLKYVCMQFHSTIVKATGGSPWYRATAPSFVHEFLKLQVTKLMNLPSPKSEEYAEAIQASIPDFWPILDPYEDSFARQCLRGGRTDVKCMKRILTQDEIDRGCKILYIDVNSMYPGVQMSEKFPVGLPSIEIYDIQYTPCITHSLEPKCNCTLNKRGTFQKLSYTHLDQHQTTEQILNDDTFFGFGCFTTIPPKDLFIPLTVVYSESEKKCLATLRDEDHREKFDTSESLKLMLRNGYKLVKIHAFHRYKKSESIWRKIGFGDLILEKMKVSSSAPPVEERPNLERIYEEKFGMGEMLKNSWNQWQKNKAKKIVYKVLINSAWGKHVQRLVLSECELFNFTNDISRVHDFWENIINGNLKFKDGIFLGPDIILNRFEKSSSKVKLDLHNCYTPAAIFVPEYGRLQLVNQLLKTVEPLYHDTDSIICFHDPTIHPPIDTSDILGEWGEEDVSLISTHGGIREFVAMGPKSYAVRCADGYSEVKAKGIRLNYATENLINFEVMKEIVTAYLENRDPVVVKVF